MCAEGSAPQGSASRTQTQALSPAAEVPVERPARCAQPSGAAQRGLLLYVEIINACNCRCRGCARSNHVVSGADRVQMSPEHLRQILQKAAGETSGQVDVGLYNWSEPFLHSDPARMIAVAKAHASSCRLSSNFSLHLDEKLPAALNAGLDHLIVSVSGFTEETYGQYHVGGSLPLVKRNLDLLARIQDAHPHFQSEVHYIELEHNLHERDAFAEFCRERNLTFRTKQDCTWTEVSDAPFPVSDWPDDVTPYSSIGKCSHIEHVWTLDWNGDVYLCCHFWYREEYRIANFLETPLQELIDRKRVHPRCICCNHFALGL